MITSLIRCKVCQKVISEPARIIGDPQGMHEARIMQQLLKHIQSKVDEEMRDSSDQQKPHCAAWGPRVASVFTYQMLMCSHLFELTPELESRSETDRARFHESSRKQLKITDEELASTYIEPDGRAHSDALRDLRDRYEEIGRYAPAAANAENGTAKEIRGSAHAISNEGNEEGS